MVRTTAVRDDNTNLKVFMFIAFSFSFNCMVKVGFEAFMYKTRPPGGTLMLRENIFGGGGRGDRGDRGQSWKGLRGGKV